MLHAEFAVPPRVRLRSMLALHPPRVGIYMYLPGAGPVDCMHKPLCTALHAVRTHCIILHPENLHHVGSTKR